VLASHPQEVRSFYDDTVAPLAGYDEQYSTDLLGTLSAYLDNNRNMAATRPPSTRAATRCATCSTA